MKIANRGRLADWRAALAAGRRRTAFVATLVLALLANGGPAIGQIRLLPDEVERVDVVSIERDGRDLIAFDALAGSRVSTRLEVGEEISFERSRGRIGLVLTNRRALGVASGSPWLETRFGVQEEAAESGLVEDRVALVTTDRRALAFTGFGGWIDLRFTPNEAPIAMRAGAAVGVVVTNRRGIGISPALVRFIDEDLRVRERIESIKTQDTLVTVRTEKRILVFSAPRGVWSTQTRAID